MSDLRDSSLALEPDFDVLDAHGIRSGQSDDAIQLDSLGFMLVTVEDDEAIVWAVGTSQHSGGFNVRRVAST